MIDTQNGYQQKAIRNNRDSDPEQAATCTCKWASIPRVSVSLQINFV